MAVKDILPFENLHHHDIRDTLNAHGGVCDNVEETYYLPTAKINEWSRYKPIRNESLFFSMSEWKDGAYRGTDGQCGFDIPVYTSQAALVAALEDGTAMWTYLLPDGVQYPFRRIDFCGYNPNAENPIGSLATLVYLRQETTGYYFDINVEVVVSGESAEYNLSLDDFSVNGIKLSEMYLGIYLKSKSGLNTVFATGSEPVGSEGMSTTIKSDSGATGEYDAYLFLSEKPQVDSIQDCTMLSLNKEAMTLIIDEHSKPYVYVSALWDKENGAVTDIELTFINPGSSGFTFSSIGVNLVKVAKGENPSTGELMTPIQYSGTVYVESKSSVTEYIDNGYTNIFPEDGYDYYIVGYADGADTHYNQLEEQMTPAILTFL